MTQITTVKQHLDIILAKLQQEQEIPVEDENGQVTTVTVDMRNFAAHFLTNHLVTTVNQYGMITYNYSQYTITNEWHNHEIPHYEDEERYTPSEIIPPPENSMCATWEEYADVRCEVAAKFVQKMMESICLGIDLLVKYQATVVDAVKVILDGIIAVLATGTIVVTAGGGAPISVPVGLVLLGVVEIIAMFSKFVYEAVGEIIKAALQDAENQHELICAIYSNKTPDAIKTSWDETVDSTFEGIHLFIIRKLLKHLLPNRHALALAEGVGQRSLEANCGGCVEVEPIIYADFVSRPATSYTYGAYTDTGAQTIHPIDYQDFFGYNVVGNACNFTTSPDYIFDLGTDGWRYTVVLMSGGEYYLTLIAIPANCSGVYTHGSWSGEKNMSGYRYLIMKRNPYHNQDQFTIRLYKDNR